MNLSSILKATNHVKSHPGVRAVFSQDRTGLSCVCFFWPSGCYAFINLWFHASVLDLLLRWHSLSSGQEECSSGPAAVTLRAPHRWHLGNPFIALLRESLFPGSGWLRSCWTPLFNEASSPAVTWKKVRGRIIFFLFLQSHVSESSAHALIQQFEEVSPVWKLLFRNWKPPSYCLTAPLCHREILSLDLRPLDVNFLQQPSFLVPLVASSFFSALQGLSWRCDLLWVMTSNSGECSWPTWSVISSPLFSSSFLLGNL